MAADIPRDRKRGVAVHGREAGKLHVRAEGGRGAEALEPKPKGRPKGSRSKPRERTREQELEERCRRLETEIAYLKKLRALVERDGL